MEEDNILSLDDLKKVKDLGTREIFIPEWNGKVILSGISYKTYKEAIADSKYFDKGQGGLVLNEDRVETMVIIKGMIEPNLSEADVHWLESKSCNVLRFLYEQIMLLSSNINLEELEKEEVTESAETK